ncbi:MAG TPA: sulfotransferase domain-containing protein [Planctomycetota bacterium]|nr:sulfotransferase domain-containing protein [Planctomycetota bacterium]
MPRAAAEGTATGVKSRVRRGALPNALFVGPQKAGTTWAHAYLESRRDVTLPHLVKETFFFDRRFRRGLGWYARRFRPTDGSRRIVEVAPSYFHAKDAPARARDALGEIPIISCLRDPAARAFSLYLHLRRYGKARGDFRAAIRDYPQILDSSRYATHLARWFDLFGRTSVLVLFLDDLKKDPQRWGDLIAAHLELDPTVVGEELHRPVNEGAVAPNAHVARAAKGAADLARFLGLYRPIVWAKEHGLKEMLFGEPGRDPLPRLSDEDRAWFTGLVRAEIDELESMLGVDLSAWKA